MEKNTLYIIAGICASNYGKYGDLKNVYLAIIFATEEANSVKTPKTVCLMSISLSKVSYRKCVGTFHAAWILFCPGGPFSTPFRGIPFESPALTVESVVPRLSNTYSTLSWVISLSVKDKLQITHKTTKTTIMMLGMKKDNAVPNAAGEQKAHESRVKDPSALKKSRFRLVNDIVPTNLYFRIY